MRSKHAVCTTASAIVAALALVACAPAPSAYLPRFTKTMFLNAYVPPVAKRGQPAMVLVYPTMGTGDERPIASRAIVDEATREVRFEVTSEGSGGAQATWHQQIGVTFTLAHAGPYQARVQIWLSPGAYDTGGYGHLGGPFDLFATTGPREFTFPIEVVE